jgi:peptidoglycan/xylan/chitin deacetylase (PgdA/CDA1 family)
VCLGIAKTISRKILFPTLVGLGFDKLLLQKNKTKQAIVNFHGVSKVQGKRFNNRHLDANEFEKFIVTLKKNYEIVPLRQLFDNFRNKTAPKKRTIALTFDDGYINNFTVALPILKKHHVPATFYLITESLENSTFYVWPDVIDLVQKHTKEDIVISAGRFKYPGFFCAELNISLVDLMKTSGSDRETYLDEIKKLYPNYLKEAKEVPELIDLVHKNELEKYKDEVLIEYGSHTHLHYNLEFLNEDDCSKEVNRSKKIIEDIVKKPVISLAFPDGSYNAQIISNCKKAGYENVVAVTYKLNENNGDPFILSRFTVSNSTTSESNLIRLAMDFDKFGF